MTRSCREGTLAPRSETAAIVATVPNRPGSARGAEQRKHVTFSCLGHGDERPRRTERSARRQLGAPPTGDSNGRIPSPGGPRSNGPPHAWGQQAVRPEAKGQRDPAGSGPRDGWADALIAEQEIAMNNRNGGVGIIGVIVIVVVILLIVGVIKL
jgi:hypothetical protein